MIKQKGICDVCTHEFDLNNGSFAVSVTDAFDAKKGITVHIVPIKEATNLEGYVHACGKACLYRHLDKSIDAMAGLKETSNE